GFDRGQGSDVRSRARSAGCKADVELAVRRERHSLHVAAGGKDDERGPPAMAGLFRGSQKEKPSKARRVWQTESSGIASYLETARILDACGPFGPCCTSNSTFCPSFRVL